MVWLESDRIAQMGYTFYDFTTKYSRIIDDKQRVFFMFYGGRDKIFVNANDKDNGIKYFNHDGWGNVISSIRYSRTLSPVLFGNVIASYSQYFYNNHTEYNISDSEAVVSDKSIFNSGLEEYRLKLKLNYFISQTVQLDFGAWYSGKVFNPGGIHKETNMEQTNIESSEILRNELTTYWQAKIKLRKLYLLFGTNNFWGIEKKNSQLVIQPRIKASYHPVPQFRLFLSYSKMVQDISLFSNTGNNMPGDIWLPYRSSVGPSHSHQFSGGISKEIQGWIISADVYFKRMFNLGILQNQGVYFSSLSDNQNAIDWTGEGTSYGIEGSVEKKFGSLTGRCVYTFSKTDRETNDGVYNYEYDRRHVIAAWVQKRFTEKFDMALSWQFATSRPYTFPVGKYEIDLPDYMDNFHSQTIHFYGGINQVRFDNYSRFDLSFNFTKQLNRGTRIWNITLYNSLNRFNGYSYIINENTQGESKLNKIAYFPLMPFVNYTYKF